MIGVDIGHVTQYTRVFDWRGVELGKAFRFDNNKEKFEAFGRWVEKMRHSAEKTIVIVGAEPTSIWHHT